MKRAVAIGFIIVFLFNVIGYFGVYVGMTHYANNKVNLAIENGSYNPSETLTIKIPLALPYPIQNGFESVAGDFEHQGKFYKLVQQKYENDTVYIVCLQNKAQKKAVEVMSDLVKQSTDQSSVPNQNAKSLVGFLKDYNPTCDQIILSPRMAINIALLFEPIDSKVIQQDYPISTPPPDFNC